MIGNKYKVHKDNVIDLFSRYKEKRGDVKDGVDIKFMESRVESLKNGKFTLAVAGEVKAGKSTFINALLGEEILPSGVLQTSSAIVEIFKSEKSFLKVKYADGREEEIYDNLATQEIDEAKDKLQIICSIPDEYRAIPTTLLDDCIKGAEEPLEVTASLIEALQNQSKTDLSGEEKLLKKYIGERTKDKIPVEIHFGYPLTWEFDEFRIVDSPGVNAVGGVQNISFQYFSDANAILFIHNIKPVESEHFKKFVNEVIRNRSKEMLFLVLTHASSHTDNDIKDLHSEAVRIYKNVIHKERILVVDSLLQLIHNDLNKGKTIEQIEDSSEEKSDILPKYQKKAKKTNKELIATLSEYAGFKKMVDAINKFSEQAPSLQLQEICESIKRGYEDQDCQYGERQKLLKTKKRYPQEFEVEINRIIDALEKYENLMRNTVEDLNAENVGKHTGWNGRVDELKTRYPELIQKGKTIEEIRKHVADGLDEIKKLASEFSRSLTEYLLKKLKKIGKTFQAEHKITLPEVDLNAIEENAKKNAYKTVDIMGERTADVWDYAGLGVPLIFRDKKIKVGEKQVYDEKKHLGEVKNDCEKKFYACVRELLSGFDNNVTMYKASFGKDMKDAIEERQKALEKLKEEQLSNDEIIAEIGILEVKKNNILPELKRVNEILGDVEDIK